MNSMSIELALTTGMRCGEVCALRWSDFDDAGAMTVSHALGNGPGGFYLKEPKTGSFARHPPHLRCRSAATSNTHAARGCQRAAVLLRDVLQLAGP